MSSEEHMSSGGGYRKPVDPKKLEQIKKRWKEAEEIRKRALEEHKAHDVPTAEDELLRDLKNMNGQKNPKSIS